MEKKDGRALPYALRAKFLKQAVARVLAGESPEAVIEALNFHRSCIYDWLSKYDAGGNEALNTRLIPGRPRKFSGEHTDRLSVAKIYRLDQGQVNLFGQSPVKLVWNYTKAHKPEHNAAVTRETLKAMSQP